MAMIFAAIGFTNVYTYRSVLVHAAEVGAYKGAISRNAIACQDAVRSAGRALNQSKLTVNCSSAWIPGSVVTVTVGYPWAISFLLFSKTGTTHYTTTDIVR